MTDHLISEYQAPTDGIVDFAIVTALKVERDAMLSRLDRYTRIEAPSDPYSYYRGQIDIPMGGHYEVVVMQLIDPGNVNAATEAAALVSRWKPKNLLMVGIAGGIQQEGVEKGDVVVARFVYYYEMGKRTVGGEQRRPVNYRCDRILLAKASNYEAAEWKGEVNVSPPLGSENYVPRARFGPIGCGELVIADKKTIPLLLTECPKMLAVAMEGAGVAQVAENNQVSFLEIRGISDLANPKKNDRWHIYAANSAAAFTRGFLRSKPVYPLAEEAQHHAGNAALAAPPLVIMRLQSQRSIRPDEILGGLPPELKTRDHETVGLDFSNLVEAGGKLTNPEVAVARLIDPQGELMAALSKRGGADFIFHGHAHIPLLVLAGYLTTDRQPVHLFDFHPGTNSWAWPNAGTKEFPPLEVHGMPDRPIRRAGDVVVRVGVSYPVVAAQTHDVVPQAAREINIGPAETKRDVITSEEQVRAYGLVFRKVLDGITERVPKVGRIHLFYAGPVTLAYHFGQQISENIHPPVVVWNYSRKYDWGIDLSLAATGEDAVIRRSDT